jgi:hypothetical protein
MNPEPERDIVVPQPIREEARAETAPRNGHTEAPRVREERPAEPEPEIEDPNRPRKKGWWQKRLFG